MSAPRPKYCRPLTQAERWSNWVTIRGTAIARRAAREGWSWSLKCGVLDESIRTIDDIDPVKFLDEKRRADDAADKIERGERVWNRFAKPPYWEPHWVTLSPALRETALSMRANQLQNEIETQIEIERLYEEPR